MNEGSYSDTLVKVNTKTSKKVLRVVMIAVAVILLLIGLMIFLDNPGGFVIILIIDVVLIYFLPSVKVEYEYVYVDGQIDFDRIIAGNSRKNMDRFDLDNVYAVAYEGSRILDEYKNQKVKDYSSNNPDDTHYFAAINGGDKGDYLIKFTPDEKLVTEMKEKSPFRVHTKEA